MKTITNISSSGRTLSAKLGAWALAATLLFGGALAHAQTTSVPSPTVPASPAPTAPNTGIGGGWAGNYLALGVAGVVLVGGAFYLARRSRAEV